MPAEDEQIRLTLTTFVMLVVGSRGGSVSICGRNQGRLLIVSNGERGGEYDGANSQRGTLTLLLVVGSRERSLPEWRQEESQLLMVSMERGGCEGELETIKQGQSREDEVGRMK